MLNALKRILSQAEPNLGQAGPTDPPTRRVLADAGEQSRTSIPKGSDPAPAAVDESSDESAPLEDSLSKPAGLDRLTISLPLEAVAGGWPPEIRLALGSDLNRESWFHLPIGLIEPGLRRGCVSMRWRELAALADPPVTSRPIEAIADCLVEVPLDQVVSIYLLQAGLFGRDLPNQLPEDVPDLFQSGPAPSRTVHESPVESALASDKPDPGISLAHAGGGSDRSVPPAPVDSITAGTAARARTGGASATPEAAALALPLAGLLPRWPKPVRRLLRGSRYAAHQVRFPVEQIQSKMRRGRVLFAWSEVRSWIVPAIEDAATSLPGSLKIRVPFEMLDEPYREWQRANTPIRPTTRPAADSLARAGQGRATDRPSAGVPNAAAAEIDHVQPGECSEGPNRPPDPAGLEERLRAFSTVERVFAADRDGRIISGGTASTIENELAALVPELERNVLAILEKLGSGKPRWLVAAGADRAVAIWPTGDSHVVAVARIGNVEPVELSKFITARAVAPD